MKPSPGILAIALLLTLFGLCSFQFGWRSDPEPSRLGGAALGFLFAVGLPLAIWAVLRRGRKSAGKDTEDDADAPRWPGRNEGADKD